MLPRVRLGRRSRALSDVTSGTDQTFPSSNTHARATAVPRQLTTGSALTGTSGEWSASGDGPQSLAVGVARATRPASAEAQSLLGDGASRLAEPRPDPARLADPEPGHVRRLRPGDLRPQRLDVERNALVH